MEEKRLDITVNKEKAALIFDLHSGPLEPPPKMRRNFIELKHQEQAQN